MTTDDAGRPNKLARLIKRHELDTLPAELERQWTRSDDERMSLRELADYVNQRLLAAHAAAAGEPLSGPEARRRYRQLTDEDATSERTQARRELERVGVDVDTLREEFISHQTVHTYLTEHRDVEYEQPETATDPAETIGQLKGRTRAVTASVLEQSLEEAPDYEVFVDINVYCPACERRYTVEELLAAGGCACVDDG